VLLPVIIAFVIGAVVAGVWVQRQHAGSTRAELSPATKTLLAGLPASVTIHYYSLLPAGSTGEALPAFSGRVQQLLDAVQAASDGKVTVSSTTTPSDASATAASADGVQAFNLDKGDACYLGLAIASGKSKESMARLQPEWEPALEYDLARAIARIAAGNAPAQPAPEVAKPSPEIIASIKTLVPDVNTVSVEQASQIFHAEYLKQCGEVGAEAEANIQAAQQKVVEAQAGGSAADLEAARKNLLQVQLAQGEKLKALATQLQTQLAVFQRMKDGTATAK
jgi:hypothetical protein